MNDFVISSRLSDEQRKSLQHSWNEKKIDNSKGFSRFFCFSFRLSRMISTRNISDSALANEKQRNSGAPISEPLERDSMTLDFSFFSKLDFRLKICELNRTRYNKAEISDIAIQSARNEECFLKVRIHMMKNITFHLSRRLQEHQFIAKVQTKKNDELREKNIQYSNFYCF